jgi:hypothetical protein
MDEEKLKELIAEIEAREYKYDFEIADAFKQLAAENELSEEQNKRVESEFVLFRFMAKFDLDEDSKRFKPVVEYTNGTVFPDDKVEITQARLDYYLSRADETKNPIMLARYLDINYEYNKKIDKSTLAPKVVEAYIAASKAEGQGNEMDRIDCIARAFFIARENKENQDESYKGAIQNIFDTLTILSSENLRWCIELLELVVKYRDEFTQAQLVKGHEISKIGVERYRKEDGSFMILESYLDLEHKLSELIDSAAFDPESAARESAQLYIDQAARREDSLFVKQLDLLKAEKILRDAGLNTEANKIHKEVEALGKDPAFDAGFQEFSFEQQIPTEEIIKLKTELENHRDKAGLIAFAPVFLPSWRQSKKEGSTEQYASISDMVNSVTLNEDGMPVAKAPDNPKLRRTMRYYDASVVTCGFFLVITLQKVIEEGNFTMADLEPQLEKIKSINPDTYESVRAGFEHFFDGNYYEALSILIPQLEDLLGDLVVGLGMPRYRQSEEDLVEYKTLGPILSDLKKHFGDDVYHFLHYQLIDPSKENLRNKTGHGKIKKTTPNLDKKAITILQAYLVVLVPLQATLKTDTKNKEVRLNFQQ